MKNIRIANNKKIYDPFLDGFSNNRENAVSDLIYPNTVASYNFEPILNSVNRISKKITFDESPNDMQNISKVQSMLNNLGYTDSDGKKLSVDGIFGYKTKSAYDSAFMPKIIPDKTTESLRLKNQLLVSKGMSFNNQPLYFQNNSQRKNEIANLQTKLNKAGFTDFEDKPLKVDGVWGPVSQSAINSYVWENSNKGIMLMASKAHEKPGFKVNPNKRKGSENRQPTGSRERNVGHPDGEEHSRVAKGSGGRNKHSGIIRNETISNIGNAVVGGAAALSAGYLIYRGVRMLPSLLPPLWWTIPANLIVA